MKFEETPVMSSYLLALIVGPFKSTPLAVSEGVPVKVWCVADRTSLGTYAQQVATRLLPFTTSISAFRIQARSLDLIAIPDFEAGAMENLGAIHSAKVHCSFIKRHQQVLTVRKLSLSAICPRDGLICGSGDLVTAEVVG
ncbi:MAG: hypothetical protein U0103_11515 [Candidatus Obscuribacterales bacterium]